MPVSPLQFVSQLSGCEAQGAESLSVSCFLNTASFAFYNGPCSGTPYYQGASKSGACAPFTAFGSSYIVYCGDSASPSPSPTPSATPASSATSSPSATRSITPSASVSPSAYPSQSPCAYCHPWGQYGQNPAHTGLSTTLGPRATSNSPIAWPIGTGDSGILASVSSDGFLYTACSNAQNDGREGDEEAEDDGSDSSGSDSGEALVPCAYSVRSDNPVLMWTLSSVRVLPGTQPAIGDSSLVFYASTAGLVAIDRFTGAVKWQTAQCKPQYSPSVYNGYVLTTGTCYSYNAQGYVPAMGSFYESGAQYWQAEEPNAVLTSPLAIGNNKAYLAEVNGVFAVNALSGEWGWRGCVAFGQTPVSPPVVGADGTLFVIVSTMYSRNNALLGCDGDSGQLLWSQTLYQSGRSSLAVGSDGVLVTGETSAVSGFSARSGSRLWYASIGNIPSVFTVASNGLMYAGSAFTWQATHYTSITAVNETSGSIVWQLTYLPDALNGMILAPGSLYVIGAQNVYNFNEAR